MIVDFKALWNNPFMSGNLADYVVNLTPADTIEEADTLRRELDMILMHIKRDPSLLTDGVFDAMGKKGMADPSTYGDHVNRCHVIPQQVVSLHVIQILEKIAPLLDDGDTRAIDRIEEILAQSADLDTRRQAAASLRALCYDTLNVFAADALHRQSSVNSHPVIRTQARRHMLDIGKQHEDVVSFAINALQCGVDDPNDIARNIAVSLMLNWVRSPLCSIAEVRLLKSRFQSVADREVANSVIQENAQKCVEAADHRLQTGQSGPMYP